MEPKIYNEICRSADFIIDSSQIIRKSQIPLAYKYAESKQHCKNVPFIDTRLNYIPDDPIKISDWCPQPVILYNHTEDCNPSVRINEFAQLPKNKIYKSIQPAKNYISTDEAQIQYLASRPICFLVCGKPGLDEQKVAKELATFWNCCYLDPETAIEQEIESKSRTGRFIEYNLRSGRAIGGDIIISVIKQLVASNSSRHQGFVISGLPLIPNELFDVDEPLASEEAVFAAEQILDNLLTTIAEKVVQDANEMDEDSSYYSIDHDELPELGSKVSNTSFLGKSQKFDLYLSLKNQLNDIFNCFHPPFVIIYLKSTINEILMRRDKLRYDIRANEEISLSETLVEMVRNPLKTIHYKRLTKEVRNFGRNVRDEVEHYVKYVQPMLDQFILNHDQQYVITIDARLPLSEINEAIRSKLNTLPLQKVITVEKFSDIIKSGSDDEEEEEEKESESSDKNKTIKIQYDFTEKTSEDVFKDFQNLCTIGPKYRWQLSHWRYYCPVALRHGRIVTGKPTNAVRFMNHIYFLENHHAMCLFTRNPRTYLLPPNPQFPGKIYLFGVEYCGVRDAALCLSYVYNLGVVDIKLIMDNLKKDMIKDSVEKYRNGLIEEYYDQIYQKESRKWETASSKIEQERKKWLEKVLKLYATYQFYENELMQKTVLQEIRQENPFWDSPVPSIEQTSYSESFTSVHQIEDTLRLLNVPVDTVFITEALEQPGSLFKYMPKHLEHAPKPVKQVNFEIDPATLSNINYLTKMYNDEKFRDEDFQVTEEDTIPVILEEIHKVENTKAEETNNYVKKSGWIIVNAKTSSLVETLFDNGIVPNIVLYFYDDDVDSKFLIRKYECKNFADYHLMKKFLKLNGFESAAKRCPGVQPDIDNTQILTKYAKESLDSILKSEQFKYVDKLKAINGEVSWIELEMDKKAQSTDFEVGEGGTIESSIGNNLFTLIEEFDNEWDRLNVFFVKLNIIPIHVKYARNIEDVMLDTARIVNSQFRKPAKDFDDDERIQELAEHDVSMETEEEEDEEHANIEMSNRNLGDTLQFCPIALLEHNVLWKGKNDFGALYENKLYFFSNEHAKEEFIANPSKFVPFRTPKHFIPPLRICIVGPIASGKTTIGKMLAKEFGLIYVNYLDLINKHCLPAFMKVGRKNQDIYITENVALKEYNPNETEQKLFNAFLSYFEGQSPLPTKYLNRVLPRLWQREPYSACGLLLDGYPFSESDFEYMANNYLIPDVVISLRIKLSTSIQRSLEELLTEWKRKKFSIIQHNRDQYEIELTQWKLERQELYNQLLEEKIANRIEKLMKNSKSLTNVSDSIASEESTEGKFLTMEEAIIEAKNYEEEDKKSALEQVDLDLEKPVLDDDLESEENAEIRLMEFIEDSYADECNLLQNFEQFCENHSFPFVEINANRPKENILLELLYKLDSLKMRNESFLEKTFSISLNEARRLLNIGYYFLSNYGYSCPVQMYDNQNPLQLYQPGVLQNKIYPVIHRQYIYYLNDAKNLKLFQENPLKYTQITKKYPIIAFRVSIIGPPKCGKSSLAERYANEFGFQVVTRGEALRYVLNTLPYTLLACRIDNQLRRGEVLDHCLVMEAVEVYCSRSAAICQGIVFDGFPLFTEEMELLFNSGETHAKSCKLPQDLPKSIDKNSLGDLKALKFAENGHCIVCYIQSTSFHRLVKGSMDYIVFYKQQYYIFCSNTCQKMFMQTPDDFTQFKIHLEYENNELPQLDCNSLPTMGYLQQTQGHYLVKACTKIGILRPKYPKLSGQLSALIYFGLYLKVNNPKTTADELNLYKKYLDEYESACSRLKQRISRSKQLRNPYLKCDLVCADEINTLKSWTEDNQVSPNGSSKMSMEEMEESIDEEIRRVPVPDDRFEYLCEFYKPVSKVPAFLTVVDIAGLVKGASEGQGLGNAFLSEISACDAIFHLCRAFENEDVIHVEGDVNPIRDLEIIADELRFKDIEKLNKELEKLEKTYIRGNDKKLKPEYDTLQKVKTIIVDEKAQIRFSDWNAVEIEVLNKHLFLTSKPGIYLVNLSETDYIRKKNKWLIKIKEWVDKHDPGASIIPFSGALELKLADMPDDEKKAYLEANKTTSALDKIIVTGYKALQLEYFFTSGPDEVKAWTIQKGTKAPGAAGRIHTHFEKGFIMAEVMKFSDFKEEGSEAAAKAAGKYRQQGRNYVVEDGDIIYFKANTGAGLTKEVKKK